MKKIADERNPRNPLYIYKFESRLRRVIRYWMYGFFKVGVAVGIWRISQGLGRGAIILILSLLFSVLIGVN